MPSPLTAPNIPCRRRRNSKASLRAPGSCAYRAHLPPYHVASDQYGRFASSLLCKSVRVNRNRNAHLRRPVPRLLRYFVAERRRGNVLRRGDPDRGDAEAGDRSRNSLFSFEPARRPMTSAVLPARSLSPRPSCSFSRAVRELQLPRLPAFIPIYQSALFVNDLITAVFLLGQSQSSRSNALSLLAGGYLFTALMSTVHALTFPGLFAPSGLLDAGRRPRPGSTCSGTAAFRSS